MAQHKHNVGFFDIETDGLNASKVFCLAVSVDNEEPCLYSESAISNGLEVLDSCKHIVAHNGISFDIPVLSRLYRWKPKAKIWDTMLMSQIFFPDRPNGHSLEAWGKALGHEKIDYKQAYVNWQTQHDSDYEYHKDEEWTHFNPVMGDYCKQDTLVLSYLWGELAKEYKTPYNKVCWDSALKVEHEFAKGFARQASFGVKLNSEHCYNMLQHIDDEMARIEREVEPQLPNKLRNKGQKKEVVPPKKQFKANGEPTALVYKWFDDVQHESYSWVGKKFGDWYQLPTLSDENGNRLPLQDEIPMRLKDQQDLKQWLMDKGWVPTQWNYKTKPDKNGKMRIVRDDNGDAVPTWPKFHDQGELCPNLSKISNTFNQIGDVVKWVVYRHRRGLFQSFVDNLRDDGRVSAQGITMGTPTARVTHKVVANIPKASDSVMLGKECRQCFTVPESRIMVGVDAEGLELRMLAHYMNDDTFTDAVVNGKKEDETDIHNLILSAVSDIVKDRDTCKNVIYGLIYGAGDKKLGQTAGYGEGKAKKMGKTIRDRLAARFPKLGDLVSKTETAAKRGYVVAIDGRKIPVRSEHAALNTLLQSAGSIVVKVATNYANRTIRQGGLKAQQIIHYHDEVQFECHPDHSKQAEDAFIDGLKHAGKMLGVRCPLSGSAECGVTWADTH